MSDSQNHKMNIVSYKDLQNILSHFSKTTYRAKDDDPIAEEAMQKCIELTKTDYSLLVINNNSGDLSPNYPSQLIILEYEQNQNNVPLNTTNHALRTTNTIYESLYDVQKLRDLINKARFARCRARFPLPVILYKGKYICRSATLSGGPEIYGRSGLDYLFYGSDNCDNNPSEETDSVEDTTPINQSSSDWQLFGRVRSQDIKLLKTLNVGTIVDFMVEKKKVKFGVNVTSSEKVDKENRYADFTLISLPYPGCEFFRDYRDNNYSAEGLVFDWSQAHVDASISIPEEPTLLTNNTTNTNSTGNTNNATTPTTTSQQQPPAIEWHLYKHWDLVQITQNYMKLLLKYLQEHSTGLLIHCISGWDRTPLFVSLLRLSLWADGLVHQSLDAQEILYFTIAYDWMLFGHKLAERLGRGEEIFFFCFYMLKHLVSEEFSALVPSGRLLKCKAAAAAAAAAAGGASSSTSSGSSNSNTSHVETGNGSARPSVIRTDSDLQLDGIMLENDLRGSNVSLNSSCSSVSSKSQDQTAVWYYPTGGSEEALFTNGNPTPIAMDLAGNCWSPHARRTSPVAVPTIAGSGAPSTRIRQRQESSSSLSVGSWQMITGTGSLRSSTDTNLMIPTVNCSVGMGAAGNANQQQTPVVGGASTLHYPREITAGSQDSNCTIVDDDPPSVSHAMEGYDNRKKRLLKVREIFYSSYHTTIGFKFKNEASLGSIFGNIAENFGFSTTRP